MTELLSQVNCDNCSYTFEYKEKSFSMGTTLGVVCSECGTIMLYKLIETIPHFDIETLKKIAELVLE